MKERAERWAAPALSFLLPGLVMLAVSAALGMAPFGDNTILISDMSTQYVEFFCALKNGDLFFSWSKALGTAYVGVFSYYVSSPLSLLTLLVPNEAMPVGLLFLAVLKIALAGLAFCLLIRRRYPLGDGAAVFASVCYALMSYNAVYAICIMWLDGVIWLPLILLALERILAGRGAGPFVVALALCFVSTWYISYMIGIFCTLYLCARLYVLRPKGRELGRIAARFFGGAACALGLTAWLWLPTFLSMFNGKFSGGNVDYPGLLACTPLDILSQLRPGQYRSIASGSAVYLFCGSAALVLAAAYFLLPRFSRREKLANGGLLAVLAASLLLSPLDKAWHLFQRPNWFPFRYSFVVSFTLLYLAAPALGQLLKGLRRRKGEGLTRAAAGALVCLTVMELGLNTLGILSGLMGQFGCDSYAAYRAYYADNAALVEAAYADGDGRFFRLGAAEDRGHNSPLSFGYPGITHYSSLYNYDVNRITRQLGHAQTWMWCAYYGSTPATDALFGVKYVISGAGMPTGYEPLAQAGELTLWRNPDVLPLAFLAGDGGRPLTGETPFQRQDGLYAALLGEDAALFAPLAAEVETAPGETTLRLAGNGQPLYLDLSAGGLRELLVNGEHLLWLGSSEAASVHYLGAPAPGEEWTVTVRHGGAWAGTVWCLDLDALHTAVERLDTVSVTAVERGGRVRLSVPASGPRTLCTTIPAEDGWTAWVDGKRTEAGRWLDTFLTVELPEGACQVELRYTAPGLIPGLALGLVSAAGWIGAYTIGNLQKKKYNEERRAAP